MDTNGRQRLCIEIRGAVQGVGFRPFVYRLATELKLKGWVKNTSRGVEIEAEGPADQLKNFLERLPLEKPPVSSIVELNAKSAAPIGYENFEIKFSQDAGEKSAIILPDLATCTDCVNEIFDPKNRRYRYPFTNCTNCGPRFSILTALPYDRSNTTMKHFEMCQDCHDEYEDPMNRRFHAQPNACRKCGPQLALWDRSGNVSAEGDESLLLAEDCIREGGILALKGLGGFQLICDARNDQAVMALRNRKSRPEKPLAIMAANLNWVMANCDISDLEREALLSIQAPILLVQKQAACELSDAVAPENPNVGVMLPYTPLHHLLLADLKFPVVATSGNLPGEPICIGEQETLEKLSGIADLFLVHNRPIARHVDDSVVRVIADRPVVLRRARGYAPLTLFVKDELPTGLAVGAHQKSTIAVSSGKSIFLSQHISDLDTASSLERFVNVIGDFQALYNLKFDKVVCDAHPDYLSTKYAIENSEKAVRVQHHVAHLLSGMAEHSLEPPVLGVVWDGTGYGPDGTIWGGEFFVIRDQKIARIAHLKTFSLPGGEEAVREPRRTALGLLCEIDGDSLFENDQREVLQKFSPEELRVLRKMLSQRLNSPVTSSAGRLFDGVASLLGIQQRVSFEGQAAMALEFGVECSRDLRSYSFEILTCPSGEREKYVLDWSPMIQAIVKDQIEGIPSGSICAKFHQTLAEMIVAVAKKGKLERVLLSGGCFQNKILTELTINKLKKAGFAPFIQEQIPPNDGGIALGQIMALARRFELEV